MLVSGLRRWSDSSWKLPATSGVLLAISYYSPLPVLNFLALVPLLVRLERQVYAERPRAFRDAFLFGLTCHVITFHFWVAPAMSVTWLALGAYLLFVLGLSLRIAASLALASWLRRRSGASWVLLLPLCWLSSEWLVSWGDLRTTGDHLAYGLSGQPFLIQFADLLGPYGVTAFILVTNALVYELVFVEAPTRRRRNAIVLGTLWLFVMGYDAWAFNRTLPDNGSLRVALIQPNVPIAVRRDDALTADEQWATLERLTREAATRDPDLIVWPESARPWALSHWLDHPDTLTVPEIEQLARELDTAILIGLEYARVRTREDYDFYNAAMLVDRRGTLLPDWGAKTFLVPFVEGVPFAALLEPLVEGKDGAWSWVSGAFDAGPQTALLPVGDVPVGVVVCYEQLFHVLSRDLRNRGAELQAVITNDAWWGRTAFQQYQADALRFRAIENRTSFVRVANTGISGFVDRRGLYHGLTPLFEEAVRVFDLERAGPPTVYDRIGDGWLVVLPLGLLAIAVRARRTVGRSRP